MARRFLERGSPWIGMFLLSGMGEGGRKLRLMGMMSSMTTQEWLPPAKMRYTFLAPMLVMWWNEVRDSLSFKPLHNKLSKLARAGPTQTKHLQLAVHAVS